MGKKGSYIGGSTVITIRHSDKHMARRKEYWRRKRGHDQVEKCIQWVGDNVGPRLIKRQEMQRPFSAAAQANDADAQHKQTPKKKRGRKSQQRSKK